MMAKKKALSAGKLLAKKQRIARRNGRLGGRPSKHGEPTVVVPARLPESVAGELETACRIAGIERQDALLRAVKRWLADQRARRAAKSR